MALPKFDRNVFRSAAAGLAALAAVSSPMAAAPAYAGDVHPAAQQQVRAIDQVELRGGDIRGKGVGFGEVVAVKGSGSHVVLKIHTDDQDVIDTADTTLRRMVMLGYPQVALLLADGPNGPDNTAEIYVRATDGKPRFSIKNLDGAGVESGLMRAMEKAYPAHWKPSAALDADEPDAALN